MSRYLIPLSLIGLAAAGAALAQPREEISLNGTWQFEKVKDLGNAPPAGGWQTMSVPGYLWGFNYERAWFKRSFDIPATMAGKRLKLHFGGVKYNSTVYVNGQKVGGEYNGFVPFECDITSAAKVGATNELWVGLYDWTGVFKNNLTDFSVKYGEVREVPRDNVLAPIGGMVDAYGIWDEVRLCAVPETHVGAVTVVTSVRQGKLAVTYTLANDGAADATLSFGGQVLDGDRAALTLPDRSVTVPAGKEATVTVEQTWAKPRYWSFEDPHLYWLVSTLRVNGQAIDEKRTRFGFREVWTQGHRIYLNGVPCTMLATSWWPPREYETREQIADTMRKIKAANCRIFRTHTQPWVEQYYEVADEVGLMMVPEGPVWNDDETYRVNDPEFWRNYEACLRAMVERDRNHPAVVAWSLENEFYGSKITNATENRKDLARLGTVVKQLDPTRPIYYESDGDPEGVADIIGIHYPHEYPDYTQWPNTAYWLDQPLAATYFFTPGGKPFVYDRKKPVYIGEFLWIPSSTPASETLWFGDEAYLDYTTYHVRGKALSWRDAIRAYRHYEIAGISPWTMIEGGPLDATKNACYLEQQRAMQPVAAFVREYDHNFFGGETVTRNVDAYNDTLSAGEFEFTWELAPRREKEEGGTGVSPVPTGGTPVPPRAAGTTPAPRGVVARGSKHLIMPAGDHQQFSFSIKMPTVATRTPMQLVIRMTRGGKVAFEDTLSYSIFPHPAKEPSPKARIAVYDPSGATTKVLDSLGVAYARVQSPQPKAGACDVLIIGANALAVGERAKPVIGRRDVGTAALSDYFAAGGRMLVLEQKAYPVATYPAALDPSFSSTMTFAQMPAHPALAGISADDLKYWRDDNLVTTGETARPTTGGEIPIIVSGCAQGLTHASLLEFARGKGCMMLCQMRCISKAEAEPTATILLRNLVSYLSAYDTGEVPQARPKPFGDVGTVGVIAEGPPIRKGATLVGAMSPSVTQTLDAIGVSYKSVPAGPYLGSFGGAKLFIYEGDVAKRLPPDNAVWDFVAGGGNLLLHNVTPSDYAALSPMLGGRLKLVAQRSAAQRMPGAHWLSAYFRNEDLYWLGKHVGVVWAQTPLSQDMTDYAFTKTLEGKRFDTVLAQDMRIEGPFNAKQTRGVILASAGYVRTDIDFPQDGTYIFGVEASGSPCEGIFPAADILVDGKVVGGIAEPDGQWRTYTTFGQVAKGRHEVAIHFTNDGNSATEDRNMLIDKLFIAVDDVGPQKEVFLTKPAALAVIPINKGLVVIDEIKWDTEQANSGRARRFISGLLTGLGASFGGVEGTTLYCGDWDHDPNMHWYRREGNSAYLGDNGYIVTAVDCAQAGKYTLAITADGTPAGGDYPHIRVDVNGKPVGEVVLRSSSPNSYPVAAELPAGRVEIKLAFTNDLNVGGEDRNLHIEKLIVSPETAAGKP